MRQMGIIADDLTGASDSGVQFARIGLETNVIFDLEHATVESAASDVVVIETDSRSLPAAEAYENVRAAANYLQEAGFRHIYKKVDSTLRGNLGVEIDAALDGLSLDLAVIAPAFPKIGRVTSAGRHYLHGKPVDETEIAKDPKCPVHESDLPKLLASQSKRKTGLVTLSVLHKGKTAVWEWVDGLRQAGVELIVFDAQTDDDMQAIAEIMSGYRARILWTGSAGLADYLPRALGMTIREQQPVEIPVSGKSVVLVAGSISPTTREQVEHVCQGSDVLRVELDPLVLFAGEEERQREIGRCAEKLAEAVRAGRDAALYSLASPDHVKAAKERGAALGLGNADISNRIADALGEVASAIARSHELQGMILTGGDTAKAVCRHMGVTGIQLLDEIEPGIPLSRLVGGQRLYAVTKAGAFGQKSHYRKHYTC